MNGSAAEQVTKASLAKNYNLNQGSTVYNKACASCHETGIMNAPMPDDPKAWTPRITKGMATLIQHTMEGFLSMPAKGGLKTLSMGESANAVAYMVNRSLQ